MLAIGISTLLESMEQGDLLSVLSRARASRSILRSAAEFLRRRSRDTTLHLASGHSLGRKSYARFGSQRRGLARSQSPRLIPALARAGGLSATRKRHILPARSRMRRIRAPD